MYHKTNIWFVNTHSKGNSRYYYMYIFIQKLILSVGSKLLIQASVIGNSFYVIGH